MAQVDFFLKIDGVKGESQDATHKDEIEIMSFSFGLSQVGSRGFGGGGGGGKVSFQDFHFSAPVNASSPRLFQACATGEHFKKAVLTARKAGGDRQGLEYLKVTMTDVLISSYADGSKQLDTGYSNLAEDDSKNEVPTDQVSLNFRKIEMTYQRRLPDGTLAEATRAGWDLATNKKV